MSSDNNKQSTRSKTRASKSSAAATSVATKPISTSDDLDVSEVTEQQLISVYNTEGIAFIDQFTKGTIEDFIAKFGGVKVVAKKKDKLLIRKLLIALGLEGSLVGEDENAIKRASNLRLYARHKELLGYLPLQGTKKDEVIDAILEFMRSPDRFFVDKEVPWLKKEVRSKCDDQESSSDDRRTLVRKLRKQKGYTYRNDLTTLRAPAAGGGVLAVAAGVLGGVPDSAAAGPPAPEAGGAAVDPPEERNRTDVSKIVTAVAAAPTGYAIAIADRVAAIDLEFAQEKLNSFKTMRNLQEELTEEKLNSRKMMTESRKTMSNLQEELFSHRINQAKTNNDVRNDLGSKVDREEVGHIVQESVKKEVAKQLADKENANLPQVYDNDNLGRFVNDSAGSPQMRQGVLVDVTPSMTYDGSARGEKNADANLSRQIKFGSDNVRQVFAAGATATLSSNIILGEIERKFIRHLNSAMGFAKERNLKQMEEAYRAAEKILSTEDLGIEKNRFWSRYNTRRVCTSRILSSGFQRDSDSDDE